MSSPETDPPPEDWLAVTLRRRGAIPLARLALGTEFCALWAVQVECLASAGTWHTTTALLGDPLGPPPLDPVRCYRAFRTWEKEEHPSGTPTIEDLLLRPAGAWSPWWRPSPSFSSQHWMDLVSASHKVAGELAGHPVQERARVLGARWKHQPWLLFFPRVLRALWPEAPVGDVDPVDVAWTIARLRSGGNLYAWTDQGRWPAAPAVPRPVDLFNTLHGDPKLLRNDDPGNRVPQHEIAAFVSEVCVGPGSAKDSARAYLKVLAEQARRGTAALRPAFILPATSPPPGAGEPEVNRQPDSLHELAAKAARLRRLGPLENRDDALASFRDTVAWLRTDRAARMIEALCHGDHSRLVFINAGRQWTFADFLTYRRLPFRRATSDAPRRSVAGRHLRPVADAKDAALERQRALDHDGWFRIERAARSGTEPRRVWDEDDVEPRGEDPVRANNDFEPGDHLEHHAEGFAADWSSILEQVPGYPDVQPTQRWSIG